MIISEEDEQLDLNTKPMKITENPDEKTQEIATTDVKPPPPPPPAKQDENSATDGKKEIKPGPASHVRNLGFFGPLGILGAATIFIAVALLVSMWRLSQYYDIPGITPHFAVYSANADGFRFDSVSRPFNISTAYNITAKWDITLNITNPWWDRELEYSNMVILVYFDENPIWVTMIAGFHQEGIGKELVNATFDAVPVTVDNSLALSLLRDVTVGSSSGFSFRVLGNLGQGTEKKKDNLDVGSFTAICQMNVEFSESDAFDGVMAAAASPGDCKVSIGNPKRFKNWAEWSIYGGLSFGAMQLTNLAIDWAFGF